jgi:hypothetical protein
MRANALLSPGEKGTRPTTTTRAIAEECGDYPVAILHTATTHPEPSTTKPSKFRPHIPKMRAREALSLLETMS